MNDLLNDPTDERLEYLVRTLMRTAVAEQPAAPTIDALATLVSVGPEPHQSWLRPLTAVAAALAVVAVAALAFWPRADDAVNPTDSTVPEVVAGTYLDAYYLPIDLPDGWRIVEMTRSPAGDETYVGNAVVFERRDGSDRAVVSLTPNELDGIEPEVEEPVDGGEPPATTEAKEDEGQAIPPLADGPATAQWNDEARFLSWDEDGVSVSVGVRSRDEGASRDLAIDLRPTMSSTGPSFDIAESSDWVKVREYPLNGVAVGSRDGNAITLASDQGQTLRVSVRRPTGVDPLVLGLPVDGRSDLYRFAIDADNDAFARRDGDLILDTYPVPGASVADATVLAILESMTRVTGDEWLAAVPDLASELASATVVARFELLGHEVTVRLEGALGGVCVRRESGGASGCSRLGGVDPAGRLPGSSPATGFALSDGSWVAVSSIPLESKMCSDPQDLQGVTAASAPNGDQQVVLLVAPPGFTEPFACRLSGTTPDSYPYVANPPPVG